MRQPGHASRQQSQTRAPAVLLPCLAMMVTVAAMAWIGVAFGGPVVQQSEPIETAHLSAKTATNVTGQRTWLVVDIVPKPKMHVYAPGEKDAIPVG